VKRWTLSWTSQIDLFRSTDTHVYGQNTTRFSCALCLSRFRNLFAALVVSINHSVFTPIPSLLPRFAYTRPSVPNVPDIPRRGLPGSPQWAGSETCCDIVIIISSERMIFDRSTVFLNVSARIV